MSLRQEIRRVVDAAERKLAQPEIYGQMPKGTSRKVFAVTIAQMLDAKQLSRGRATKKLRAQFPYVRHVYGPGREPVGERTRAADHRAFGTRGFMALKREREARARAAVARRKAA